MSTISKRVRFPFFSFLSSCTLRQSKKKRSNAYTRYLMKRVSMLEFVFDRQAEKNAQVYTSLEKDSAS